MRTVSSKLKNKVVDNFALTRVAPTLTTYLSYRVGSLYGKTMYAECVEENLSRMVWTILILFLSGVGRALYYSTAK